MTSIPPTGSTVRDREQYRGGPLDSTMGIVVESDVGRADSLSAGSNWDSVYDANSHLDYVDPSSRCCDIVFVDSLDAFTPNWRNRSLTEINNAVRHSGTITTYTYPAPRLERVDEPLLPSDAINQQTGKLDLSVAGSVFSHNGESFFASAGIATDGGDVVGRNVACISVPNHYHTHSGNVRATVQAAIHSLYEFWDAGLLTSDQLASDDPPIQISYPEPISDPKTKIDAVDIPIEDAIIRTIKDTLKTVSWTGGSYNENYIAIRHVEMVKRLESINTSLGNRKSKGVKISNKNNLTRLSPGVYEVSSKYVTDIRQLACSCPDYGNRQLLCKHLHAGIHDAFGRLAFHDTDYPPTAARSDQRVHA